MSNKPTHVVYHVKSYQSNGETKDIWTRIGAAWIHEDGDGFNQQLDMVPLDGRIVTRRARTRRSFCVCPLRAGRQGRNPKNNRRDSCFPSQARKANNLSPIFVTSPSAEGFRP